MKSWFEIYKERSNNKYYNHIKTKYKTFIDTIFNEAGYNIDDEYDKCGDMFLEAGCGAANITKALLERMPDSAHLVMDSCPDMVSLAVNNIGKGFDVSFNIKDLLDEFSYVHTHLIHSHGVLEHFTDEEIQQLIEIQKEFAEVLVHYVPSNKYEVPSRGDERLMTTKEWKNICNPDEIIEFNDGYDLILIWRNK